MIMNGVISQTSDYFCRKHSGDEQERHKTKKPLERQTINNVIADYRAPDLINEYSWDIHNSSSGNDVGQYVCMFVYCRPKYIYI